MKAIETRFRGRLFRSRLEARWAVFFEALEIPWIYEPEGFELPSRKYLPDFFLPRQKTWVEIKPGSFEESTQHLHELAWMTGQRVLLLKGDIPVLRKGRILENELGWNFAEMHFPEEGFDAPYIFCRCRFCGEYGIEFSGRSERMLCCPGNGHIGHFDTSDDPTILAAYDAARTRRFEHDEAEQWD